MSDDTHIHNGPSFYGGLLRDSGLSLLMWDRNPKPDEYRVPRDKHVYNVTAGLAQQIATARANGEDVAELQRQLHVRSFGAILSVTCEVVPQCKYVEILSATSSLSAASPGSK